MKLSKVEEIVPKIKARELIPIKEALEDNQRVRTLLTEMERRYDCEFSSQNTTHAECLDEWFEDGWKTLHGRFLQKLKGQILVDLGAGKINYGYDFAKEAGARSYVAVEPFNYETLLHYIKYEKKGLPSSCSPVDMLTFIQTLPKGSVSFLCSGIDGAIISGKKYYREVENQIQRALHRNGVFVSNRRMIKPRGLIR